MSDTPRANAQSIRELIAFRIGEQEYSVDVRAVREIRGWTPAMRLPHSPDYVLGVINLRGQALPIVDLAARMGFAPAEPTSRHAIIVAEIENENVGLLVDGVSEIFSTKEESIQPTPDIACDMARSFVRGVIPGEGRMISVLALERILTGFNAAEAL
jgi:purine-binding chemotaxis protein CheW